eukprot:NODE_281_length_11904_cov_0.253452.p7 type:complete len:136 gc:universal NODE_281_length_11904_cov_0.253452:10475-10882(+)
MASFPGSSTCEKKTFLLLSLNSLTPPLMFPLETLNNPMALTPSRCQSSTLGSPTRSLEHVTRCACTKISSPTLAPELWTNSLITFIASLFGEYSGYSLVKLPCVGLNLEDWNNGPCGAFTSPSFVSRNRTICFHL